MMDYVFRMPTLTSLQKAKDMLTEKFSGDYGTYFSIIHFVASGLTPVSRD